jgi:hypothetical protein
MNVSSNVMAYGCSVWFLGKLTVYPESVFIRNSTDQWRIRSAYESICLVIGFKVKPIGRKFSKRQGVLLDSSLSRQQQQQLDAIFTSRHLNWGQNDFFFFLFNRGTGARLLFLFFMTKGCSEMLVSWTMTTPSGFQTYSFSRYCFCFL